MWAHLWYGSDIFRIEFELATTDKKNAMFYYCCNKIVMK